MTIHPIDSIPGYAWLEGQPGNLLYRDDRAGDTIIPGHQGRWVTLDECDSLEEAEEVAGLWRGQGPTPRGACRRMEHDRRSGLYSFSGAGLVEEWDEVRQHMDEVEDKGPLQGWEPYTRYYCCTTYLGDTQFYAVAE